MGTLLFEAYQPGSKNVKPDALSRYFESPVRTESLETTSRPKVFVNAIEMDIERTVKEAVGCKRTWRVTRTNLVKAAARMKKQADKRRPAPTYRVGPRVWLSTKEIPIRGCTKKLAPRYVGPFSVTHVISPTTVRLRLPSTMRRVHPTFHVSRLKPAVTHALCSASVAPPPPRVIDGGATFRVNKLMDCRRRGRGLQYLVDWEGYSPEHRAWTPVRFILDKTFIRGPPQGQSPQRRLLGGVLAMFVV